MANTLAKNWESLGSIRLTLWLLCIIIAISFAGAIAPQPIQQYIFYSWWFLLVLGVFGLNLLACLCNRLLFSGRGAGSKLCHAAVLVILAGSLVSFLAGRRGSMEFTKGETQDAFIRKNAETIPLGFSVTLEDFTVEWYKPQYFKLGVTVEDKKVKKKFDAVPGKEYRVGGTGYSFTVKDYFPQLVINVDHEAVNLSDKALNPALRVEVRSPSGTESRWIFAHYPDMVMGSDKNIRFFLLQEPAIKEFRSRLRFSDGSRTELRDVRVNSPVEFGGYTFYQSGYNPQKPAWTSLEVVRDPGAPVVFVGFVLMNLGIVMIYAGKWLAGRRCGRADIHA
jgi:cytochrome c biogenesis protein ResB